MLSWAMIWSGKTDGAAPEGTHWVRRGEAEEREERARKRAQERVEEAAAEERVEILRMLDSSIEHRLVYGVQLGQDPNENPGLRKAISLIKARGLKAWDPIEERVDTGANAFSPQGAQEMAWLINRLADAVNELRALK